MRKTWLGFLVKRQRKYLLLITSGCLIFFSGCRGMGSGSTTPPASLKSINHIIFMAQENRGFDHYFGAMRQYWAANGIADQSFDGLPEFNPASGPTPLQGSTPANPGCDPAFPSPSDCTVDLNSAMVQSFHLVTMCLENPSPSWDEGHVDWNRTNPLSGNPTLDGFVYTAAHDARAEGFFDVNGVRAMGYYSGSDLPYYYFLASNFGTSDRWFTPAMTRTQPNRLYMLAGTSAGHAYPPPPNSPPLNIPTIFDELQTAGITWKVYVTDLTKANPPTQDSALNFFATAGKYPGNIVGIDQYFTDLANGTLPSVAYIEPGYNVGLDEHPGTNDNEPGAQIQAGAQFVSTLINGLMQSSSWQDSVFILTFDEGGGFYDHVQPQPAVSPDGIPPQDLLPGDICTQGTGPTCDFVYTGYRVPMIVVSPFSRKNYVSHTVADYTAWLKLVETRFGVSPLTRRDGAQMDMTEFFDFNTIPWATPPAPPAQPTGGPCYMNSLP